MRQIVIVKPGAEKALQLQEKKDPEPQNNEVVVAVKASGVNFADVLARKGLYPDSPKLPCVVGYEVAGVVEKIGKNVPEKYLGKSVLAITRFQGYSEKVAIPVQQIFEKPPQIDYAQAASIPVNYLTAYQLLIAMGGLRSGESVLIHNAGGGVGLAALDLAKHIGAISYGTSSPSKHQFLLERGLNHAIDYRSQDWEKCLSELTQGKGVELVIDPIGGNSWKKSYRALRSTGRLGMFGVSVVSNSKLLGKLKFLPLLFSMPLYSPVALMNGNKGVFGVNMGRLWHEPEKVAVWMQDILEGVAAGWVRPHVDKTFPFEQVWQAHQYLEQRKNIGKVVLVP